MKKNQLYIAILNIIVAHAVRAKKWFSKVTGWMKKCFNMLPRKETQQQLKVLRYKILWFFLKVCGMCHWMYVICFDYPNSNVIKRKKNYQRDGFIAVIVFLLSSQDIEWNLGKRHVIRDLYRGIKGWLWIYFPRLFRKTFSSNPRAWRAIRWSILYSR